MVGSTKKGAKFWLVFVSLCVTLFLSALDYTALASALPVIVHELKGSDFAWIGTAYALTSTAFLPMSGGLAQVKRSRSETRSKKLTLSQIVGRRIAFIIALFFFALGSALCGAAQSMDWLIAARAIQGIGGGAIISLSAIVISDLVTLQERGTYNGLLGLTWAVAVAIGPIVGDLNLPVCAVSLVLIVAFMSLPTPQGTLKEKLSAMDWFGNLLVLASSSALVLALTWGGARYQWGDIRVLLPLIIGILGLIVWLFYEVKFASHPTIERWHLNYWEIGRLFRGGQNRFSKYIQVFVNSLVVVAWVYFMPVYFQACKDAGPIQSGIDMFGGTLTVGPFIVFGGVSVTVWKVYRPQLWVGWILLTVGMGVLSIVDASSPLSHSIGICVITASGAGIIFVTLNAQALACFAFIWGIAFGGAILTNELKKQLPPQFVKLADGGVEKVYALIPEIQKLPEPLKGRVQHAFGESLRPIWYVLTGIAGLGLLCSLLMKDIPLHNYVDEEWALDRKLPSSDVASANASTAALTAYMSQGESTVDLEGSTRRH
ncbi:MFS multidrug transporter [Coprinopsis cinerea okayama7|uniref:MFS multidrug transporter n=1 Tax=Coprinopsis cinerea (strain Okayama-7 / 130 / ATCC MYA-4618 / FGSC 9003) TaxID=240176 RepID=A8NKC1_COPC7|nr:MFS multidrug transporter [Coprinopsis cinerea okayama7\|eukprot:XP_001834406.2 MFS multidrug transporter [Coprinopsis cinerea okayama7\